jgi:hypothetical protein
MGLCSVHADAVLSGQTPLSSGLVFGCHTRLEMVKYV